VGIVGTIMTVFLLALSSVFVTVGDVRSETIGFFISLLLVLLIGFFNIVVQLSFYAMIGSFGGLVVSRFTIGTGFSGLIIILIRIIIAAVLQDSKHNKTTIMVFAILVFVFGVFDLWLNIRVVFRNKIFIDNFVINNPESKQLLQPTGRKSVKFSESLKEYVQMMRETFTLIHPYPLLIFLNYFINSVLYPNLALYNSQGISKKWSALIFIFMYCLGDSLGKIAG
jgi:hypothetical protein